MDLDQPPSKKQKVDDTGKDDEGQAPAQKQKPSTPAKAPSIIKLAASHQGDFLVVITEDKCVHVFAHSEGQLVELSQRIMPKRPCAVQILPDNATILVADKFGDVYSLPLIPTAADSGDANAGAQDTASEAGNLFKPSADLTTIHSKRNRQVLEAQMKQKNFTKKKDPLKFEHKILIGHVSMLTDMRYMSEASAPQRGYIVTADRDEHIRVSRGPPQSHVIEGFCLGHTEFVSKVRQLGNGSSILVSGGGDDWLGVWDWTRSELLRKLHFKPFLQSPPEKIAVSGMWNVSIATGDDTRTPVVVVALEGIKTLLLVGVFGPLNVETDDEVSALRFAAIELTHNPIDVVSTHDDTLIVALDNRNSGGKFALLTMRMYIDNAEMDVAGHKNGQDPRIQALYTTQRHAPIEADAKDLDTLLYGVSNLRKRRDLADGEANGDENDESVLEPEPAEE